MKKIAFTFIAVIIVIAANAQVYDWQNFQLNENTKNRIINSYPDVGNNFRGTGIDNAEMFNDWAPMFVIFGPIVPQGWLASAVNMDILQSQDAYIGDYAVHLETGYDTEEEEYISGLALTGAVTMGGIIQGEVYTERPSSVSFQIKGELLENDSAMVFFQSTLNSEFIGGGGVLIGPGDIIEEGFTQVNFPIEYESEQHPDSAVIIISSAAHGIFEENIGTITEGSFIIIDNIVLNFANDVVIQVEDDLGEPLDNVAVSIFEEGSTELYASGLSNEEGIAEFQIPDGNFDFELYKEGYYADEPELSFTSEEGMDTIISVMIMHDGPHVLERTPEIGEIMVMPDAEVSITFTVDIAELDFDGISIADNYMNEIVLTDFNISDATLNIEHNDFEYNTFYTITIPAGAVEDEATNEELAFDIFWSFTTINPIDSIYDVNDIEVFFLTPEEDALNALDQTTTIEDITGGLYSVNLDWTFDEPYDEISPGNYAASAVFELPEGVHQTEPETELKVYATVTVLEAPLIDGIDIYDEVYDVVVFYETSQADAIEELVSTVTISDTDGGEHEVILDWTIDSYNGEEPGDYNATGTFTLPFGVDQTDPETPLEVHAIVTVLDPPVVVDIDIYDDVQDITVPYQTSEEDAIAVLEADITIMDSYDFEHAVVLEWSIEDYDGETPGDYDAVGTFDLPEGLHQTEPETELVVYATVTVMDKPVIDVIDVNEEVEDIEVDYGTSLEDAKAELQVQIRIRDTYQVIHMVNVSWEIEDYDGETPDEYDAVGTFSLPPGVYQTDPETPLTVYATVTVLEPSSVADFDVNAINLYPNPSEGVVNLTNIFNKDVQVYDNSGKLIKSVLSQSDEISIDLSNYAKGTYFIRVNNETFKVNIVK